MKLKIGIDLDDTVWKFNERVLKYCNNKFSKNYTISDCIQYKSLEDLYDLKGDDFWNLEWDIEELKVEYELLEDVLDVLNSLNEKHEIYFITARHERFKEKICERLYSYLGFCAPVYFCHNKKGVKKDKIDFCIELGIDVMIDDAFHNLEPCANSGIKCFLINYPWNKNFSLLENIIRVEGWSDIKEEIGALLR